MGPRGTYLICFHYRLIHFKCYSGELKNIVAEFMGWLKNKRTPLAAYCVIVAGHLIGLDKPPEVRPVGVVETCCRMTEFFSKGGGKGGKGGLWYIETLSWNRGGNRGGHPCDALTVGTVYPGGGLGITAH